MTYELKARFISPGTFFSEESTIVLDQDYQPGSDDVNRPDPKTIAKILAKADSISERHGATPFAFTVYVAQKVETEDYLGQKHTSSNKVEESQGRFFLGGQILSKDEIFAKNDPSEQILRDNMRNNDISHVIVNANSYKTTQVFDPKKDTLLDYVPPHKKMEMQDDSYRL